ncbi:MAG: DUF1015 domain-containing protein [Candidatus Omnitrophica bacterium]|nr:DUF1015 domain-containing protein [Candidatus Omnitrophota bacterium]
MPTVKPFKAVRYNKARVSSISAVMAPPYDVISEKLQDELYRGDPHNVVRLILNKIAPADTKDDNRYTRSKQIFDAWMDEGVLARDDAESFYIYTQSYKRGSKKVEQVGFIGLMELELEGKKKILPHENTLAAPKEDRLKLTRSVRANLEPIFILHDDNKVTKLLKSFCTVAKPVINVEREGVRHMVWQLSDQKIIKAISKRMKAKGAFIADGHHRYEVSKMFAKESEANPKYIMVYFVEADEDMLTVLPAHRLIKDLGNIEKDGITLKLKEFFTIEKVWGLEDMMTRLAKLAGAHAFGMYLGKDAFCILKLKDIAVSDKAIKDKPKDWKRLDVSILHLFIFQHLLGVKDTDDNIGFLKDPSETKKAVDDGEFKAAFFLNPTEVAQVKKIAKIGERMPRKATYFYPKQLSGLVFNKF